MDAERQRYFDLLRRTLDDVPEALPPGTGRGIVTCGSARHAPLLWLQLHGLRHHGCTLPIEVWHRAGEIDPPLRRLFEPYGVSFREAEGCRDDRGTHPHAVHALKPYAIAHSAFREVLFLDADNCAFRDPTFLFETSEFRTHRALFWPDWGPLAQDTGGPELRRDFGLRDDGWVEFESGQIVIDRFDRRRALALTRHLNEHCDYYYRFLSGDKETFRMAFDLLGGEYLLIPAAPILHKGLIQHWTDGGPLFHHRCGDSKDTLLRPGNLLAVPPAVVRGSGRAWRQARRPPRRERAEVYGRAWRRAVRLLSSPPTVRSAIAKRFRTGLAWAIRRDASRLSAT